MEPFQFIIILQEEQCDKLATAVKITAQNYLPFLIWRTSLPLFTSDKNLLEFICWISKCLENLQSLISQTTFTQSNSTEYQYFLLLGLKMSVTSTIFQEVLHPKDSVDAISPPPLQHYVCI
jgi:hypothetical protein